MTHVGVEGTTTRPRISVVIPVHDRPIQIWKAVSSVLRQSMPVTEIIIVDDGSTRPVENAELQGQSVELRILRHAENAGAPAARNTGIEAASGDWVAFLDSDDAWHPEKLATQFAQSASFPRGGPVFLSCNGVEKRAAGDYRLLNGRLRGSSRRSIREAVARGELSLLTSSLVVPTDLARRIGFKREVKVLQDYHFALGLFAAGASCEYADAPLYLYDNTGRADQISAVNAARIERALESYRRLHGEVSANELQEHFVRLLVNPALFKQPALLMRSMRWILTTSVAAPFTVPYFALCKLTTKSIGLFERKRLRSGPILRGEAPRGAAPYTRS